MSLVNYTLMLDKQALKDLKNIKKAGLKSKVDALLSKMQVNPFCNPPSYEKLKGDLAGAYSRRINLKHRLIYKVDTEEKVITIIRTWTHYDRTITKL